MGTKIITKIAGIILFVIGAGALVIQHPVEVVILIVGAGVYYVADKYLTK